MAGTLLSGLDAQNSGCAGAHYFAEDIEILPQCRKLLHGEVVAFGNLIHLIMEGCITEEIKELYNLYYVNAYVEVYIYENCNM